MAASAPNDRASADATPEPTLADVKARFTLRLPQSSDAASLAEAWSRAVLQQAINANLSSGPPPTALSAVRADLLMHVCKEIKRLVTERETEVILRVPPNSARSIHRQMKAIYEDSLNEYILTWAFWDAELDGAGSLDGVKGDRVVFKTKEAVDSASAELTRIGTTFKRKRDEENKPYLLVIEKAADISKYLAKPKK